MRRCNRILSLLLCLAMLMSLLPMGVLAEGTTTPTEETSATDPVGTDATDPVGTDATEPDATDPTEPDATDATEPDATDATEPDATDVTEPDATDATEPDATDATEPDATDVTEPDATGSTEPDATDATEPDATGSTEPAQPTVSFSSEDGSIQLSVSASALESVTAALLADTVEDDSITAYASYDITVTGFETGDTATVTLQVPQGFDAAKQVSVWDGAYSDGVLLGTYDIVEGSISFTTTHFSRYDLTQSAAAPAADDEKSGTIYLLAGSDYQNANGHGTSSDNVKAILDQINQSHPGISPSGLLFAGDYTYDYSDTSAGISSLLSAVQSRYPGITAENSALVQGNHDSFISGTMLATGGHHMKGYGVYVINEDAYPLGGGIEQTVYALSLKLYDFLHTRMTSEYAEQPVFIVSHVPLHFSARVAADGSGKYAHELFDVINNAGHAGLNIFFLFGHNHSNSWDEYLGGEAVYMAKGTTLPVPDGTGYSEHTLQFTYMNAGYTGYYSTGTSTGSNDELAGTSMTLFTINGKTVTVERFGSSGPRNLKDGGTATTGSPAAVTGTVGPSDTPSPTTVHFENVTLYADSTNGITIKVVSSHTMEELMPTAPATPLIEPIVNNDVLLAGLNNELIFSEYYAYQVNINETINAGDDDFFGTVMASFPEDWKASNVMIYMLNDDGSMAVIPHKISSMLDQTTGKVVPIVAFRADSGGAYAIAQLTRTNANAPVQYTRVDTPTLLRSDTYLIIFDASRQVTNDAMVLPRPAGSTEANATMEFIPNISQYEVLGVQQYNAAYEWHLELVMEATEDNARRYCIGVGADAETRRYLKISGQDLIFVGSKEDADIFHIEAAETNPENADSYAFSVRNEDGMYLALRQDAMLVGATAGDSSTMSRFVFMERTLYNPDGTLSEKPASTVGNLIEVSDVVGSANYVYHILNGLPASDSHYLITGTNNSLPIALNTTASGNRVTVGASSIAALTSTTAEAAGTALEWSIEPSGSSYRIYKTINDQRYYLRINTRSLAVGNSTFDWTITNPSSGNYTITGSSRGSTYYLYFSGTSFAIRQNQTAYVRLYNNPDQPATAGTLYAIADNRDANGQPVWFIEVPLGTTDTEAMELVKERITVKTYADAALTTPMGEVDDNNTTKLDWIWLNSDYDPQAPGYYPAAVVYLTEKGDRRPLGTFQVRVREGVGELQSPQQLLMTTHNDDGTTEEGRYYVGLEGPVTYDVPVGTRNVAQLLSIVQQGITGYRATDADLTENRQELADSTLTWEWMDSDGQAIAVDPNQAGEYPMTIRYINTDAAGNTTSTDLGLVYVNLVDKNVNAYALSSYAGSVRQDSAASTVIRDSSGNPITITIQYTDGTFVNIPVTVGMLFASTEDGSKGDPVSTANLGLFRNLDVYYGEEKVNAQGFTLQVIPRASVDYPEYPDQGSVKVNKTATGMDFQSTGITRVELSASGLPIKKGADVIVMMDTSSSMSDNNVSEGYSRSQALSESLENLISILKTPGDDGEIMDIRVAIADFNGYNTGNVPYQLDTSDRVGDEGQRHSNLHGEFYTLSSDSTLPVYVRNFLPVEELQDSYAINDNSGTNYDHAMDTIYQLGYAIQEYEKNRNNGAYDRDLFVVFLSDGAPFQWNYYTSNSSTPQWNSWLLGSWDQEDLANSDNLAQTHTYYYDMTDWDGDGRINEHRMATAIKGDPRVNTYEIIRKNGTGGEIGGVLVQGYQDLYNVRGLGATMFSIAFDIQEDKQIQLATQLDLIDSIASPATGSTTYSYNVSSAAELNDAFRSIAGEITYAATKARFLDQMGDSFSLQRMTLDYTIAGTAKQIVPSIEILSYQIYSMADHTAGLCDLTQVGTRKVGVEPDVLEVVMFTPNGEKAYSSLVDGDKDGEFGVISDGNGGWKLNEKATAADEILSPTDVMDTADPTRVARHAKVIYAKTFVYNCDTAAKQITGIEVPTTIVNGVTSGETDWLDGESFYWHIDTITANEVAMRYYVYLDGSMEGTLSAGSYATNNYAVLYYDNYRGTHALMSTTSPTMAWKSATVSYAFYLVNSAGVPVVNQSTGMTGPFANRVQLTAPVVYQEVLLNSTDKVTAMDIFAQNEDVLPKDYVLYDSAAAYTVKVGSDSTGEWSITKGAGKTASTYVTNYSGDAFTNAQNASNGGYDYSQTIVWFAVVWTMQPYPDTVVIDYGTPVTINALANDMFGVDGSIIGVGDYAPSLEGIKASSHNDAFSLDHKGKYGTATISESKETIVYTPTSMAMDGPEIFSYEASYTGSAAEGIIYQYCNITVIPATSIYYEDTFLNLYGINENNEQVDDAWTTVLPGAAANQDEDRPGKYSLSTSDANNVYGFDSSYQNMATHSMGGYSMITVREGTLSGRADFTFTGTGFDVISMVSNQTGAMTVEVKDGQGKTVRSLVVDSYYGFQQCEHEILYTCTLVQGTEDAYEWVRTDLGKVTAGTVETPEAKVTAMKNAPTEGDTYTAIETGWSPAGSHDVSNPLYQVPVMQVKDLPYGRYTASITAFYHDIFHHGQDGSQKTEAGNSYDFYLDAIRVYDPADISLESNAAIKDAYLEDNEAWPRYYELRNILLSSDAFTDPSFSGYANGAVYIDGKDADVKMADYLAYGPNNEVYLKTGNAVAFNLDLSRFQKQSKDANGNLLYRDEDGYLVRENDDGSFEYVYREGVQVADDAALTPVMESIVADVQIGVKSADGKTVLATVFNVDARDPAYPKLASTASREITTATELYYSARNQCTSGYLIGLKNDGEGIMSVTNIKVTFTEDPTPYLVNVAPASLFSITEEQVGFALMALCLDYEASLPPVADQPEADQPEASEPVDDQPEASKPEASKPEASEPEADQPVASEPVNDQPVVSEPVATYPIPEELDIPLVQTPAAGGMPGTAAPNSAVAAPAFAPDMQLVANFSSIRVNSTLKLTVTTGLDVASLTVNGITITDHVQDTAAGKRTWVLSLQAEAVGDMGITVLATGADGIVSDPYIGTVAVTEHYTSLRNLIWDILNWIANLF